MWNCRFFHLRRFPSSGLLVMGASANLLDVTNKSKCTAVVGLEERLKVVCRVLISHHQDNLHLETQCFPEIQHADKMMAVYKIAKNKGYREVASLLEPYILAFFPNNLTIHLSETIDQFYDHQSKHFLQYLLSNFCDRHQIITSSNFHQQQSPFSSDDCFFITETAKNIRHTVLIKIMESDNALELDTVFCLLSTAEQFVKEKEHSFDTNMVTNPSTLATAKATIHKLDGALRQARQLALDLKFDL